MHVLDDRGRTLLLPSPPSRIVSLVPSDTYTLVRLGGAARLVGRTRYCVEPQGATDHAEVVGGVLDPDIPQIVALRPDVVVANQEDNRRADVERLEAAGIPVLVSHPTTVRAGLEHAARLHRLCAGGLRERLPVLEQAAEALAKVTVPPGPPLRTLVPIWQGPLVAVGPGTFADDLLSILGATNVAASCVSPDDRRGPVAYPRLELGAVAAAAPELVLLPDEPYCFTDADAERLRSACAEGQGQRGALIRRCSGKDLFWYGLGALDGLPRLGRLLTAARAELSTPPSR
jgi:ABC-type Fe3+-hydroxamate transport system substrate-binding protein